MRFPSKLGLKIWCACWLVLLALPIFRVRLGEIPSKPLIELSGPHWRQGDDDVMAANAAKAQAIRAQFPDEPIALVEALSLEPRGESYARDYLALARRFPKERWLQLGALREGAFGGGGVIETGQDKSKAGVVQEMSRSQRAVYGELLDLAKQLEGREPQNAFPSWMRAYYAFSLGRDAEALQGLQNAARSRGFDDGLRAYLNKVSEWKLRQGATWESLQKSVLDATFPHFHGMRVSANRAVNLGWGWWEKGERDRAIQIWNAVQKATNPLLSEEYFLLHPLLGNGIQKQSQQFLAAKFGAPENLLKSWKTPRGQKNIARFIAQKFRGAGFPNAAKNLEFSALRNRENLWWQNLNEHPAVYPLERRVTLATARTQIFWAICALFSLGAAIFWTALWVFTRSQTSPTNALGNAFSLGATLFLWGLLSALAYLDLFYMGGESQKLPRFLDFWPLFSLGFWIVPAIFGAARATGFSSKSGWKPRISREKLPLFSLVKNVTRALLLLAFGVSALLSFLVMVLNPSLEDTIWGAIWPWCWIVFLVILIGSLIFRLLFGPHIERRFAFIGLATTGLSYAVILWAEQLKHEGNREWIWLETLGAAFFVLVWSGFALRALGVSLPLANREFWRAFGLQMRAACATLAVSLALICVILGLILWPTQRALSLAVQEQVKIGSRAWLEKQGEK